MRVIEDEIEVYGGKFVIKHKPQVVGEDDSITVESEASDVNQSNSEESALEE